MSRATVVFCADRRVIPGLHVAAASVLLQRRSPGQETKFVVISDDLAGKDLQLLARTLSGIGGRHSLERKSVDSSALRAFPSMAGSWGAYYRLFIPAVVACERSVYIDVDTLCCVDVAELLEADIGPSPAAFVAEGTVGSTADASIRRLMPGKDRLPYLNSGVMVADHRRWNAQLVTERCLRLLQAQAVDRWDQTALNVILEGEWFVLDRRFNFATNCRANWPSLTKPEGRRGKILHFLDSPKPWDPFGEWIHPQHSLWQEVLDMTEMRHFRSWKAMSWARIPRNVPVLKRYANALKDRALFSGYSRGWLRRVKGVTTDE